TLSERVAAEAFDLSAHRGGRGLYPENTLVAFSNALSMGVTSMEMDAAVTRDGVAVISHDQVLNRDITRGPDGRWIGDERKVIKTLTFKELQRYDVGRIMPGYGLCRRIFTSESCRRHPHSFPLVGSAPRALCSQ